MRIQVCCGRIRKRIFCNLYEMTDEVANNKYGIAIHRGDGVVDYDNTILQFLGFIEAAKNREIEVEEANKVFLAFAQAMCQFSIGAHQFITIFTAFNDGETLKIRVLKECIDIINNRLRTGRVLCKLGKFALTFCHLFFEAFVLCYLVPFSIGKALRLRTI